MNKIKQNQITLYIAMALCYFLVLSSCKKDEDEDSNNPVPENNVSDIDGNQYGIITIGSQYWMAENLKTTKLKDGTNIAPIETACSNPGNPGYAWYENNKTTYGNVYGGLYNWYAVNSGKLCPAGWRVPSKNDWTILFNHLGGISTAGGKMKTTGTTHWQEPNNGASNESKFAALPGGGFGVS